MDYITRRAHAIYLAQRFNVSWGAINGIVKRKNWKHI